MRIIETYVNITDDHHLSVQLPDDIQAGQYRIAIILDSHPEPTTPRPHQINQLAGKVKAFKNIDSVAWQQQNRDEWDET